MTGMTKAPGPPITQVSCTGRSRRRCMREMVNSSVVRGLGDGQPVDGDPLGNDDITRRATDGPALLGPSPDMSITSRSAVTPLVRNCRAANNRPADKDVRCPVTTGAPSALPRTPRRLADTNDRPWHDLPLFCWTCPFDIGDGNATEGPRCRLLSPPGPERGRQAVALSLPLTRRHGARHIAGKYQRNINRSHSSSAPLRSPPRKGARRPPQGPSCAMTLSMFRDRIRRPAAARSGAIFRR